MLKKEVALGKESRTRESPRCRIARFLIYFGAYVRPVANRNKRLETQKIEPNWKVFYMEAKIRKKEEEKFKTLENGNTLFLGHWMTP